MRLKILEQPSGVLQRVHFALIQRVVGHVPGLVSVTSYRRKFFGRYFAQCVQQALRAKGEWTAAELESFATFVSRLNKCRY